MKSSRLLRSGSGGDSQVNSSSTESLVSCESVGGTASEMLKVILPSIKTVVKESVSSLEEKIINGVKDEMLKLVRDELQVVRSELEKANTEIKELKELVDGQKSELSELRDAVIDLQDNANDRERHSRSWNLIWLTKEKEKYREQADYTGALVLKFLNQVPEIKERNIQLDVAHRIGKSQTGKPRSIIFRMVSKADVWFILKYKAKLRNLNQGLIFPDLTKCDRMEKGKYSDHINQLVKLGHKARFDKGYWIVDGKRYRPEDYTEK